MQTSSNRTRPTTLKGRSILVGASYQKMSGFKISCVRIRHVDTSYTTSEALRRPFHCVNAQQHKIAIMSIGSCEQSFPIPGKYPGNDDKW